MNRRPPCGTIAPSARGDRGCTDCGPGVNRRRLSVHQDVDRRGAVTGGLVDLGGRFLRADLSDADRLVVVGDNLDAQSPQGLNDLRGQRCIDGDLLVVVGVDLNTHLLEQVVSLLPAWCGHVDRNVRGELRERLFDVGR
jgi:hypothetical protein